MWFILGKTLNSTKFSSQHLKLLCIYVKVYENEGCYERPRNTFELVLPLAEKAREVPIGTFSKEIRDYKKYSGLEVGRMDANRCL